MIHELIDKIKLKDIETLFNKTNKTNEFEFIFTNINNSYINQEKYIKLLKYLKVKAQTNNFYIE